MSERRLEPRHPQSQNLDDDAAAPTLRDPRTQYPRPPFKHQTQAWPGLASRMEPRADHGETSDIGSGRLRGRRALITGGDSGMGRAAAIAFAREGRTWRSAICPRKKKTRATSSR